MLTPWDSSNESTFYFFRPRRPVPPPAQAPGLPLVDRCGSARLGPTVSARAPREVALLVRASAVGMRRSWSSRTLAVAACRAAQQGEGALSRIGMIFSTFTIRRVLRVPGQGRDVGSCPAAKIACGPEIRAVQCVGGYRGKGRARGAPWLAGESRAPARAWQAYSLGPKEKTRACSRCPIDFLSAPLAKRRGTRRLSWRRLIGESGAVISGRCGRWVWTAARGGGRGERSTCHRV